MGIHRPELFHFLSKSTRLWAWYRLLTWGAPEENAAHLCCDIGRLTCSPCSPSTRVCTFPLPFARFSTAVCGRKLAGYSLPQSGYGRLPTSRSGDIYICEREAVTNATHHQV